MARRRPGRASRRWTSWSYPNPGSGTAPQYLGAATDGGDRPDVAAAYGARFQYSGYGLVKSGLTAGEYIFLTYAYSPTSGYVVHTTTNYVDIPTVQLTIDRQGTGHRGHHGPTVASEAMRVVASLSDMAAA